MVYSVFKAIAVRILSSLTLSLLLMGTGVMLMIFSKKQRVAKILITAGFGFLLIISMPLTLEDMNKPLSAFELPAAVSNVRYVVVLAGGYNWNKRVPLSSQFNYHGLVRLVEGIRLSRRFPNAKLILSGGPGNSAIPEAVLMKQLAIQLGIDPHNIISETKSLNTADEIRLIKPIVEGSNFILVTSAVHMPRALSLCHKHGLSPIAAPTGFLQASQNDKWIGLPNTRNIDKLDIVLHEYIAMLKDMVLGNI